jgi:hypothetical protein
MPNRFRGFYYPDDEVYDSPYTRGMIFEEVFFNSEDGTRLSGWFIHAKNAADLRETKGTVIHMHGNAQNMTAHWQFAEWLPLRGYNLFTFDYRGYGQSEGVPDPKGVFEDSVASLDYVRSRTDIDTEKIFVFGQSLGGMLAIAAASASQAGIRAVVAESPIHSYSLAADHWRMQGINQGIDDTYCAGGRVAQLSPVPLLLIHGTKDHIVNYSHSLALLKDANEPKRLITIEGGSHIDAMTRVYGTKYKDLMVAFFEEVP